MSKKVTTYSEEAMPSYNFIDCLMTIVGSPLVNGVAIPSYEFESFEIENGAPIVLTVQVQEFNFNQAPGVTNGALFAGVPITLSPQSKTSVQEWNSAKSVSFAGVSKYVTDSNAQAQLRFVPYGNPVDSVCINVVVGNSIMSETKPATTPRLLRRKP